MSLWQRINVGGFNIGEFSEKSPIANINSSPINRLVRYYKIFNNISGCEYNVLVWKLCHIVTVYAFSAWCSHILVFYVIIIMFLEDLQ